MKARPGDPLYDKGMATVDDIVDAFAWAVGNDTLPQVGSKHYVLRSVVSSQVLILG
jgi:hypothetical protein